MSPRVSIIITTRNRAEHLRETLASFQGLQVPQELPAELLVVDNASTDDTAEVIKTTRLPQMALHYLHERKPGQSNARNSGMANTSGEVILFTDDDVRVPENWVPEMSAPLLAGNVDAVAGGVSIAPHLARGLSNCQKGWFAATDDENPARIGLIGANMAFRRQVLRSVPFFDPELGPGALGFGDDTLFSRQLLAAGFRLMGNFKTTVEHCFDEARLRRPSLLRCARRMGMYKAYIAWHWEHESIRHPWCATVKALARLNYYRWVKRREWRGEAMLTEGQVLLLRRCHYLRHYLVERRRARNYCRHGLTKINGIMPF